MADMKKICDNLIIIDLYVIGDLSELTKNTALFKIQKKSWCETREILHQYGKPFIIGVVFFIDFLFKFDLNILWKIQRWLE